MAPRQQLNNSNFGNFQAPGYAPFWTIGAVECVNLISNKNELLPPTPTPPNKLFIIPDNGRTGHYVNNHVNLVNCAPSDLKIRMPDGRHITASEQGSLPMVKHLSNNAAVAYKIPQLAHSLLSIGKLCDNDCTAIFTKTNCYIMHKNTTIMKGDRDPSNSLLKILIQQNLNRNYLPISEGENKTFHIEKIKPPIIKNYHYHRRPISKGERLICNIEKVIGHAY